MELIRNYAENRKEIESRDARERCNALNESIQNQQKIVDERTLEFDRIDKTRAKNIQIGGYRTLLHLTESEEYTKARMEMEFARRTLAGLKHNEMIESINSANPWEPVRIHQEADISEIPISSEIILNLVIGAALGFLVSPFFWKAICLFRKRHA